MSTNNGKLGGRQHVRHLGRYRQIAMVLAKYRLSELIRTLGLDRYLPFHWVPPGNPWHKEVGTESQRTRMAMEELGTTFVKMGQILSTRTDIVPSEFCLELAKLQNSLTPLAAGVVDSVVQKELGRPAGEVFASFDPKPLGVASIGQVHAATLQDGTEVVVKVQKPGVREQMAEDLDILRHLAGSAAQSKEDFQQYDLDAIVEEISDTLNGELDYIREGRSAEHLARFFREDESIHIPRIHWEYSTPRVLTMERIRGSGILDFAALDAAKLDRKELAKRAVGIWVKLVFENNLFHADPHPGNLFVESDGRLGLVDFGMVGLIDDEVRDHLVSAVKGILDRDVDVLIDAIRDLGAVTPAGSRESLRRDMKHVLGHFELASEDLSLASNLGDLFAVVRRNHVQLPGNTFLLLKTMAMAQSLGKGLDPDFDFFGMLSTSVETLLRKRYQPSSILRQLPPAVAELALLGVGLPNRLSRIVRSLERGELQIRTDVSGVQQHLEHLERLVNRVVIGILVAAIILALAIVFLAYHLRS